MDSNLNEEWTEDTQRGDALLRQFEAACASGELAEVPGELDRKCRQLIRQKRAESARREWFERSAKTVGRVAAVLLVVLVLGTTLVVSVTADRVPAANLILDRYKTHSSMGGIRGEQSPTTAVSDVLVDEWMDALVPDGYEQILCNGYADGCFLIAYTNDAGSIIMLQSIRSEQIINVDTEDAEVRAVSIGGYDGVYIVKKDHKAMFWNMSEKGKNFSLSTDELREDEFFELLNGVIDALRQE